MSFIRSSKWRQIYQSCEAEAYEASLSFTPNKDSCSPLSAKFWSLHQLRSRNQRVQNRTTGLLDLASYEHTALSSSQCLSSEALSDLWGWYLARCDASPDIPNLVQYLLQTTEMKAGSHLQISHSLLQIFELHCWWDGRKAALSFTHSWWRRKRLCEYNLLYRNTPSCPSSQAPTLLHQTYESQWEEDALRISESQSENFWWFALLFHLTRNQVSAPRSPVLLGHSSYREGVRIKPHYALLAVIS